MVWGNIFNIFFKVVLNGFLGFEFFGDYLNSNENYLVIGMDCIWF